MPALEEYTLNLTLDRNESVTDFFDLQLQGERTLLGGRVLPPVSSVSLLGKVAYAFWFSKNTDAQHLGCLQLRVKE